MVNKNQTISDFGEQWQNYTEQDGYYASDNMLSDYFGPLLSLKDLKDCTVCEVGSGNGRFVKIMSRYAGSVVGIEPSQAVEVSRNFTSDCDNVTYVNSSVYDAGIKDEFDYVFCLGVLHHMTDPVQGVREIVQMAKPGAKVVIWVYGKEGNGLYIAFTKALRAITTRIPHVILNLISWLMLFPLKFYILLCKFLPLPLKKYMLGVLGKYDNYALKLTIYDQLNPTIANYWTKEEFREILSAGGLTNLDFYHRHGYSWTASGQA